MPQIRTLEVIFDLKIEPYEISVFRGAIIDLVGRDQVAFHNHIGENSYHFKYPTLQYKRNRDNASIFCIEDGIEELYALFNKKGNSIRIGSKTKNLNLKHISISQPFIQVWDKRFSYRIQNWLPFSQKNFPVYKSRESLAEQIQLLESILRGNILSFGKGINWTIDKEIKVSIIRIVREKSIKYKNVRMKSFDIEFTSNVFLPSQLGLGKGASTGFGVIRHNRKNEKNG